MPKINLSTLITDIKGKSGGSVFSRNKGGNYFRNNPTPVQKKSASWNQQKTRFSSISTQWKALSEEEREAWSTMAPDYPQTDVWGKTYIPSGYQLYMKLNSQLFSNGFQPLSIPLAPTELAISDEISIYYPDNFAFTPSKGANLRGIYNRTSYLLASNYVVTAFREGGRDMCMRVVPSLQNSFLASANNCATLFSLLSELNIGQFAFLNRDVNSNIILTYVCNYCDSEDAVHSRIQKYDITTQFNTGEFHLTFSTRMLTTESYSVVYVNGQATEPFSNNVETSFYNPYNPLQPLPFPVGIEPAYALNFEQGSLRVGDYGIYKSRLFVVSDIRQYIAPNNPLAAQCSIDAQCPDGFICVEGQCVLAGDENVNYNTVKYKMIARGYVLGNEVCISPLNKFENSQFETVSDSGAFPSLKMVTNEANGPACIDCVGNDVECQNGVCVYVGDRAQAIRNLGATFTPFVLVIPYNTELSQMYLSVFATKPIGFGKTSFNQPKISVGNTLINGQSYDISDIVSEQFSSMTANSKIVLEYQVISADTGQATMVKPKKDKNKRDTIKFKAGSELSSAVN